MKITNTKGSGLVLAILVMAVLSILGVALLNLSASSARLTAHQKKSKQAYYLAKSGADAVATHLINNPSDDTLLADKTSSDNTTHFTNGKFNVEVAKAAAYRLHITGNGNASGVEKSTTAVIRRMTVGELLNKAIYTNSPLDITNMVVEGDIQSGGEINYRTTGHNQFDDTTYDASPNTYVSMDTVAPATMPGDYSVQDLVVNGDKVTISDSYKFNSITIEQNKTLEIVANDEVIDIVVKTFTAKGSLNIVAIGTGRVNLYVYTEFEVQTKGFINNDHPKHLYIYMQEGSVFDLQAGIEVKAYIIAPDAAAIIQSEKSTIFGALIANTLSKNEEGQPPNGSVVFVPQENTSEVDESLKAYTIVRWE